MNCKICGSSSIFVIYNDVIRNGTVRIKTNFPVSLYQCKRCKTIWHEQDFDYEQLYQSGSYRQKMGENSHLADFYNLHDDESLDKFKYTETKIFRNRIVADIGCGGGAFMDYVNTVAKQIICIEPDKDFREEMKNSKGYIVFPYLSDALAEYANCVDVIVSFDCIEHVDNPSLFIEQAWRLLGGGP